MQFEVNHDSACGNEEFPTLLRIPASRFFAGLVPDQDASNGAVPGYSHAQQHSPWGVGILTPVPRSVLQVVEIQTVTEIVANYISPSLLMLVSGASQTRFCRFRLASRMLISL